MRIEILKAKIHKAVVTQTELHYTGSLTVDEDLLDAVGLVEFEKIQVYNINNGARFETYVIKGKRGSKSFCVNGAAARLAEKGDRIIIASYASMKAEKAKSHTPQVIILDENNEIQ